MSTNAPIRSEFENGELVYRTRATGTEVFRVTQTGVDYPGMNPTDAWVFNVLDYGAVADGTTDDTAAINLAVAAAYAYAIANETRYAEVYFPPSPTSYVLSSATTKTATNKGNACIPLPVVANTARKVTLVFRGGVDGAAMPYFEQTTGQRWGTTLKCTLTGLTADGTFGAPSVIGGPTPQQDYGSGAALFNNMVIVVDGIGISLPINPTIGGLDFRGMAQCVVRRSSIIADGSPSQLQATPATHDWSFGILGNQNFNNDRSVFEDVSIYGVYTGLGVGEHSWVNRSASIYCHDGLYVQADSENIHSSAFGAISVEACTNGIINNANDSYGAPIHVAAVSMETISGYHIDDLANGFCGTVYLTKLDGPTGINVRGAANLEIIAANQDRGAVTAPALPATTVTYTNVLYRHAMVTVVGGTVTAITVDGVATGLTSGTVIVPSGKSIAVTYSSAPTWKWWLL